jgi:hypothetical protein
MTDDELRELRVGDRVLVNPTSPPSVTESQPEQAIFVAFAGHPETGVPFMVVAGLPDGWDEQPNLAFNLRAIGLEQLLSRVHEVERIEILRKRLRAMAAAA